MRVVANLIKQKQVLHREKKRLKFCIIWTKDWKKCKTTELNAKAYISRDTVFLSYCNLEGKNMLEISQLMPKHPKIVFLLSRNYGHIKLLSARR